MFLVLLVKTHLIFFLTNISYLNCIKDLQLGLIIYRVRFFLILEDFAGIACCIFYSHGEPIAQKFFFVQGCHLARELYSK